MIDEWNRYPSYGEMKAGADGYLEIRLDFSEPIEIGDVAALFAGLGADFQRYLEQAHPELKGEARMYVKRIHEGSLIADVFANMPDLVGLMDGLLIVGGFGALFSKRVRTWMKGNYVADAKKSDLKNVTNTLRAVAKDKSGKLELSRFEYREGLLSKKIIAEFSSEDARQALETIESQKAALDSTDIADHQRVMMVFKRMDKDIVKPGSGTGERVVVESIDKADKPVFYESELAAERIKDELTHSEFPFQLGFIVDVNVATKNGRIAAYSVKEVHDVIMLDAD